MTAPSRRAELSETQPCPVCGTDVQAVVSTRRTIYPTYDLTVEPCGCPIRQAIFHSGLQDVVLVPFAEQSREEPGDRLTSRQEAERVVWSAVQRAMDERAWAERIMSEYPPGSFAHQAAKLGADLADFKADVSKSIMGRALYRVLVFVVRNRVVRRSWRSDDR